MEATYSKVYNKLINKAADELARKVDEEIFKALSEVKPEIIKKKSWFRRFIDWIRRLFK